ncbi:MAG: hypothetical protein Q7K43_06520, partial [Candidatus Woesearchaeota archaeon]|nr:hypothetical protein [Candidatus Woesearchaeota archaeon]
KYAVSVLNCNTPVKTEKTAHNEELPKLRADFAQKVVSLSSIVITPSDGVYNAYSSIGTKILSIGDILNADKTTLARNPLMLVDFNSSTQEVFRREYFTVDGTKFVPIHAISANGIEKEYQLLPKEILSLPLPPTPSPSTPALNCGPCCHPEKKKRVPTDETPPPKRERSPVAKTGINIITGSYNTNSGNGNVIIGETAGSDSTVLGFVERLAKLVIRK